MTDTVNIHDAKTNLSRIIDRGLVAPRACLLFELLPDDRRQGCRGTVAGLSAPMAAPASCS